jgi:hypothetical protein
MAESWIAVTSDIIELENMQRGSVGSGGIEYTALDDAVVRAGGTSYSLPKGGSRLVVVGNTIHIPTESR